MDANKIIELIGRMRSIEDTCIVPGNGLSPHTGFVVFRALYKGQRVVIKAGNAPLNNHLTIKKEYELMYSVSHNNIVELIEEIPGIELFAFIMEDLPYGGRRERWRKIIKDFNPKQAGLFIKEMLNVIFYLNASGVNHNDIEFANIGTRDENYSPVLFDFGRAKTCNPNPTLLKEQLDFDVKSGNNAWIRELFGIGGKYQEEGTMLGSKFDDNDLINFKLWYLKELKNYVFSD